MARELWPRPKRPTLTPGTAYRVAPIVAPNGFNRRLAAWLERSPRVRRWFTAAERRGKEALFGCRMCGQCALPATGYACPMTCPKQLRNGPCGGVGPAGECEVHPDLTCVWVVAHERAGAAGRGADLTALQRPVDHRLRNTSSWINYWLGRDEDLWTAPADPVSEPRPSIHRSPVDLGLPAVPARTAAAPPAVYARPDGSATAGPHEGHVGRAGQAGAPHEDAA
ncbi:MAG: methylenetetrahydrofolate reductase C-terminal domain-containing protein [Pseudonocardia sp.]